MLKKKLATVLITATLALGGVVGGASAAFAGQPDGCDVYPGVPHLSGVNITGSGSGSCLTAKTFAFVYEVHKSFGVTNPTVLRSQTASKTATSWSTSATGCDTQPAYASQKFFGQAQFYGQEYKTTGNSGNLNSCHT